MKNSEWLVRMFVLFHVVLGLALLYGSIMTVIEGKSGHAHIQLLGAVEALGALLFLVPRTLRAGSWLLLLTIGVALAIHSAMGEVRGDLLVYAAGVGFVALHGAAYGRVLHAEDGSAWNI